MSYEFTVTLLRKTHFTRENTRNLGGVGTTSFSLKNTRNWRGRSSVTYKFTVKMKPRRNLYGIHNDFSGVGGGLRRGCILIRNRDTLHRGEWGGGMATLDHIYVDASFNEADYSGVGGLIIDMHGDRLAFFSARVEKEMVDAIVSKGQRTIIQELEMLAVLCAFKCWQETATIHRTVLFTDSESVRGAFLKSWSANTDSDRLLNSIFEIESLFSLPVWIERVPSQSNPAGILSREVVTIFGNATKVEVDPWEMWNMSAE